MSRILFLTPQLPYPPHQGAAIRNLNLIKLAAQRHDVSLCAFVRSAAELAAVDALRPWVGEVRTAPAPRRTMRQRGIQTLASTMPDMATRLQSVDFARLVDRADVIQAEGIEMVQYLDGREDATVFDCHNAEWVLQRRTAAVDFSRGRLIGAAYSALQWLKLRPYERRACQSASAVLAVSSEDRRALLDLDPRLTVDVVPNGVDASLFRPSEREPVPGSVLFTGTLDFRPNVDAVVWLAGEIWPRVRHHVPEATLTIAGRAPTSAVARLHGQEGITISGNPSDIQPFFAAAEVYVVPVRSGGGSRYKLLEAMSSGMGVVSTTLGTEGIAARSGEHLRVADDAASIADIIVELLRDRDQRLRLGTAARELVLSNYDWPVIGPSLWAVYERLLGLRAAEPAANGATEVTSA